MLIIEVLTGYLAIVAISCFLSFMQVTYLSFTLAPNLNWGEHFLLVITQASISAQWTSDGGDSGGHPFQPASKSSISLVQLSILGAHLGSHHQWLMSESRWNYSMDLSMSVHLLHTQA